DVSSRREPPRYSALFIDQRVVTKQKPAIPPIFAADALFNLKRHSTCQAAASFAPCSFEIVWMKVPHMSLIGSRALHLFKGMSVIVEHHLVRLKQKSLSVQDQDMLRKEIYELPELPLVLPEFVLRPLSLDGDSGNAARVIDQLNFVSSRVSNFPVIHAKGSQNLAVVVRQDRARPGGAQSSCRGKVFEFHPLRVTKDVRDEDGLPKVSGCATRSDIRTNADSISLRPERFGQISGAISQVQAVFVKKENRAQHSLTVALDQAGDTRQNFVQGCTEKDHLQRIEHRLARWSSSRTWGGWR